MNEREIIRHSRVPGMSVFLDTIQYRSPHFHPEWELIEVMDHTMQVTCDGQRLQAEQGALLLFPPDRPHEFRGAPDGSTILCLQLSPEAVPELKSLSAEGSCLISGRLSEDDAAKIREDLHQILQLYLHPRPRMALACLGNTLLLFDFLFARLPVRSLTSEEHRLSDKRNELLTALFSYINANYMHKICLTDFARAQGYSMSWLSHFVKASLNMSFQDYVTSVRVNAACKQMGDSNENLTQIALTSGFSDYRYFSKAFQTRFGLSPEQYRKSIRKPENAVMHHSIHSIEQFYTDEQSTILLQQIEAPFTKTP